MNFLMINGLERIKVYDTNITLSNIAFGALHFPEYKSVDLLINHIDKAIELGITSLDTADVYGWYKDGYGRSNDIISKAFEKRPDLRNKLEIIAKFGIRLDGGYHVDLNKNWIQESIDRYLKLFQTNYIDVLMIHNPSPSIDNHAVALKFKELQEKGVVKIFGVSNFAIDEYENLNKAMELLGMKIKIYEVETSVLHPDKLFKGIVKYMYDKNMTILGWGPLGGDPNGGKNILFNSDGWREKKIINTLELIGIKKNKNADEIAVAWLLNQDITIIPILGTTKSDRLYNQSINSRIKLEKEEIQYINKNI